MLEHKYLCSYERIYDTEECSLRIIIHFCEHETIPMFANSDSRGSDFRDSARAFVVVSLIKVIRGQSSDDQFRVDKSCQSRSVFRIECIVLRKLYESVK